MAFYIKPPHGTVSLSRLQVYADTRFQLLLKLSQCSGKFITIRDIIEDSAVVADSDCLIEGSKKDQISHFFLRLVCSQTPDMRELFIQSEIALFTYRVSCMSLTELKTMLKPIKRLHYQIARQRGCTLKKQGSVSVEMLNVLDIIEHVTKSSSWEELLSWYCEGFSGAFVTLPFHHVVDLVAKRLVNLNHGMAVVSCSKLTEVLKAMFTQILQHGMKVASRKLGAVMGDTRMKKMLLIFKHQFTKARGRLYGQADVVCSEEVDSLHEMFPPCMSHLHSSLRVRHRLRHYSRIQYTLFLKELGLPLNESIHFWRSEYSKMPNTTQTVHESTPMKMEVNGSDNNTSRRVIGNIEQGENGNCRHTWEENSRRYMYSIRHLYGLEGARTNYRGHCCTSLQKFQGAVGEDGGCPFALFDGYHLESMFVQEGLDDCLKSSILDKVRKHSYTDACQLLLSHRTDHFSHTKKERRSVRLDDKNEYYNMSSSNQTYHYSATSYRPTSTQNPASVKTTINLKSGFNEIDQTNLGSSQSCYSHDSPSSQVLNSRWNDLSHVKNVNEEVLIRKPIDFYLTYKHFLNGLQCLKP